MSVRQIGPLSPQRWSAKTVIILGCFFLWTLQVCAGDGLRLAVAANVSTVQVGQSVILTATATASHPPPDGQTVTYTVMLGGVPVVGFQDKNLKWGTASKLSTSFVWPVPATATPGIYTIAANINDEKGMSQATAEAGFTVAAASASTPNSEASAVTAAANADARSRPHRAVEFTALHTYYISPTGNDHNAGTSPSVAWATPKHSVNCGDVIIVVAGSYTAQFGTNSWGIVSNCPSTSGGNDGTGGIYFATVLCAGPDLTSCSVNGGNFEAFRVDQSNWAVEGFSATQSASGHGACFTATSETATTLHHIAFINNIASTCDLAGFDTYSWTSPGGVDQTAVVGAISYNGASSLSGGVCGSGVSIIPTNGPDTSSGTHVFVAGYFGYYNINAPSGAGCNTDGEGLIFDSWSCGSAGAGYKYQGVAEQNVWWHNGEVFPNYGACSHTDLPQIYVFGNTSYGNMQDPKHLGGPEIHLNQALPTTGTVYSFFNNVAEATLATAGNNGKNPVFGAGFYVNNNNITNVTANNNYFWQSNPGTKTVVGSPNTDVYVNGAHNTTSFPFGTNTYNNPGFANPGNLPSAAPNCAGYRSTTACMNRGYGVAAALTPSGGAVGLGYQPPGPCAADPYFPTWLKGIIYLQWDGANLTEHSGLITEPCGM